ncbi:hypothetical protein [Allorhizobium taibaishanense]|uniref:Uncharacterized protein n=1 Tax=Allorhizobium taibaishanense TaxID=887144 RepID=A0A1Q8ZYJ7_9HYPH|nr:hypothetical protein [Allorhizobium taibaishanense]MBB4008121.1 hypothetical protein [Allorhizobium taibaishanense]OLP47125.1 hypothetical protein BJF91_10535 [Allorhizobium taibaishanense]
MGNGVELKAGVITATADKDKNSLSADHLTYSDLANISKATSSSVGIAIARVPLDHEQGSLDTADFSERSGQVAGFL